MIDAIITWASGKEFCCLPEFQVFLKSVKKLGMSCDTIVFTHDMPVETRHQLFSSGFQVVDVNPTDVHLVVRDRFLEIYRWLAIHGCDYNQILLTDSKDVLFQSNPFFHDKMRDKYILLCLEGGKHYQSEWNAVNQIRYQTNRIPFEHKFAQSPIINSGFILGTAEEIKNLSLLIWSNSVSTVCPLSEQAALNYLYHYLIEDPIYFLADPLISKLCATGEAIKQGWLALPPVFKHGMLYHPTRNEPYCAFHQWERTIYKDTILEAYAE